MGQNIGVDVSERGPRAMHVAVGERPKDTVFEVRSRMSGGDGLQGCRGQIIAAMPRASVSTPAVTNAISGPRNSGTPGVVCSAMLNHTFRAATSSTPWSSRKSRAALAPSNWRVTRDGQPGLSTGKAVAVSGSTRDELQVLISVAKGHGNPAPWTDVRTNERRCPCRVHIREPI